MFRVVPPSAGLVAVLASESLVRLLFEQKKARWAIWSSSRLCLCGDDLRGFAEQGSFDTFCFALNPEGKGLGWEETGWNETGRVVEGGGGGPGPHKVWRDKAKEHCSMIDLSG